MSNDAPVFVICRQASDPLRPGNQRRNDRCQNCGRELQVTPNGASRIDAGGTPLCNPCGFETQARLGPENTKVVIGAGAAEKLRDIFKS